VVVEHADVARTRTAYDTVAVSYEEIIRDALAANPWDRGVLGMFAELVEPGTPVVDVGCGPGRIAAHLASLGLDVSGVDLSPGMVDVARRTHPGLRFDVGSMAELPFPDASLGGVVAWYSIIHTPPERMGALFGELARVLAPGGVLVTAFQVGDERRHIEQGYGHEVSLDAYRLRPEAVAAFMAGAGLAVTAQLVRQPEAHEKTEQAYLLARK
jgi:ubiquinone/menaquinone biosynthesis C-methylase UbiE